MKNPIMSSSARETPAPSTPTRTARGTNLRILRRRRKVAQRSAPRSKEIASGVSLMRRRFHDGCIL